MQTTVCMLKTLGIWRSRGTRAGVKLKSKSNISIPVRVTNRNSEHTAVLSQKSNSKHKQSVTINQRPLIPTSKPVSALRILSPANAHSSKRSYDYPTVLLCNARSLCNKIDDLELAIKRHNVQVAAITETWFTDNNSWLMNIDDFQLHYKSRPNQRGGGVAFYIASHLSACQPNLQTLSDNLETIWVILKPRYIPRHTSVIACCVVYLPPPVDAQLSHNLIDYLLQCTDEIRQKYPDAKFIILGDFNLANLTRLTQQLGVKQLVKQPTRDKSTLDLIFSDISRDDYNQPMILPPLASSDHAIVLWKPNEENRNFKSEKLRSRPLPHSKLVQLGQRLTSINWTRFLQTDDVEFASESFSEFLHQNLDAVAPVKTLIRRTNDKPWYSPQLRQLKVKRDYLYTTQGKSSQYKKARNEFIRKCKKAKANYYKARLSLPGTSNPQRWYREVKRAARLTQSQPQFVPNLSDSSPCDTINEFFSNICQSLPALNTHELPAFLPSNSHLPILTEVDVYHKLRKINPTKATSHNDIPPKVTREFAAELSLPLSHIFNLSLQSGVVPGNFKVATVIPVPKKNPAGGPSDLRPISLTPVFARVLEQFVAEWLKEDILSKIDIRQFGNLPKTSTSHYLVSLMDTLLKGLDQRSTAACLCLFDFSKAFDRVCHTTVIQKLHELGTRPALLTWICSFLTSRKQVVKCSGDISNTTELTCGLPQGTLLGPLLFLVLVNDALITETNRWKYVDDISVVDLFQSHKNSTIQNSVSSLAFWAKNNSMQLNGSKTKLLQFNFSRSSLPAMPLPIIDGVSINVVKEAQVLGLWINSSLTWNTHIEKSLKKASSRLYLLTRLRAVGIGTDHLVRVYCEFVRPILEYASPVWHSSLPIGLSNDIEAIQRRAMRIILWPSKMSYETALLQLDMEPLSVRRDQQLKRFGLSLLSNARTSELLTRRTSRLFRERLRSTNDYVIPRARTDRYAKSAVPSIVRLLNK